mmetsp:Transcript_55740/g.99255  ORF Transcript_55740/g.99255 Transcript_55740/m.99255 type:complete len:189 (+) Transcript_55740:55-621(+)
MGQACSRRADRGSQKSSAEAAALLSDSKRSNGAKGSSDKKSENGPGVKAHGKNSDDPLKPTPESSQAAEELRRLEQMPLDEESRKALEVAAKDLPPGRFEGNAYVIDGSKGGGQEDEGRVHGTVMLYNEEKAYGIIQANVSGQEAFFSKEGLSDSTVVKKGDSVSYFEDLELIEDQVCAIEVRLHAGE